MLFRFDFDYSSLFSSLFFHGLPHNADVSPRFYPCLSALLGDLIYSHEYMLTLTLMISKSLSLIPLSEDTHIFLCLTNPRSPNQTHCLQLSPNLSCLSSILPNSVTGEKPKHCSMSPFPSQPKVFTFFVCPLVAGRILAPVTFIPGS